MGNRRATRKVKANVAIIAKTRDLGELLEKGIERGGANSVEKSGHNRQFISEERFVSRQSTLAALKDLQGVVPKRLVI
jgi:hypothetical protein